MATKRALVMGSDGLSQVLQPGDVISTGGYRFANTSVPAGNTVTAQTETTFASKLSLPAGILGAGWRIQLFQFGIYSSSGVTPSIIPRIRLGGVALLPDRTIMGLLGDTNVPWSAIADFVVLGSTIVGSGILTIADNQVRIFGGLPVTGPSLTGALDLTSSAQWGQANCSITCQGWIGTATPPLV